MKKRSVAEISECKPHPYGAKPHGNMYFDKCNVNVFDVSLGNLRRLPNEFILKIFGWLDAVDLATASAVSRSIYSFAHISNLWRDLVLAEFQGDFLFTDSWKDTFIKRRCPLFSGTHVPLVIPNCFSDTLYEPWMYAAALPIKASWLKKENVDRREKLTYEEFVQEYQTKPVILTDIINKWEAEPSLRLANLLTNGELNDVQFRVSATIEMKLKNFLQYAQKSAGEERPLYLFDKSFVNKWPSLGNGYHMPEIFAQDFMKVLGEANRPDYRWLIMGPARSGSSFHVDPNSNFAWNATIAGRKKWIVYPKHLEPPLDADEVSLIQWFTRHYDDDEYKDQRYECITNPGELIYVPNGCWHCVLNLDFTVAITHNVVMKHNLLDAIDFLVDDSACEPGDGCQGAVGINISGDVPTSVIFPYKDRLAQKHGGKADGCKCIQVKQDLRNAFIAGLDRDFPGLVHGLREERKAKGLEKQSMWSKLGLVSEQANQESFSFNF